jgi:plasmid maintenance system antidote protein VapI
MKEEDKQRKRVSWLLNKFDMNQKQFADSIGVTQPTIGAVLTGRNNLSKKLADKICQTHDVSYEWLMTGKGPKFIHTDVTVDKAGENNSIGLRIIELLEDLNINQSQFATMYGVTRQMLNGIIKGKNTLPEKMALRICLNHGVSYDWLIDGNGPKYMGGAPRKDTAIMTHLATEIQNDMSALQEKFLRLKSMIEE